VFCHIVDICVEPAEGALAQTCRSVLADEEDSRRYIVLEGTDKNLKRLAEARLKYSDHGSRRAIGELVDQI
jgi:hypothetical protein